MFQVDDETMNELSQVFHALTEYLHWLIERKDLESFDKLMPVFDKMNGLMLGIMEGNVPEVAGTIDAINRLHTAITERLAQAKTPQEYEQLLNEANKMWEEIQKEIADEAAERDKREQTAKKEQKH